jgi:phage replication-related protein YjqB (UPF0714/DUF867 family)
LVIIAPHGTPIEKHTDKQARSVAAALQAQGKAVATWIGAGPGPNSRRWHITSIDICERSYPGLSRIFGQAFTHSIAFHGFDDPSPHDVIIGGEADRTLRDALRMEIQTATDAVLVPLGLPKLVIHIGAPGDVFPGNHPHNIVNRLAVHGIQIEQKLTAREQPQAPDLWETIALAVARFYAERI